jgi:hypothetical protein
MAQQANVDSTTRRNIVKLDITSHWLYRKAMMFAYERTIKSKPYHTWGITAGIQEFPSLDVLDDIKVVQETKASGFKLGAEYRFYLQKENKHHAPRGVYLGPYTTFHQYHNERVIEVDNNGVLEQADLTTNLNIFNIGFQLGYQFVLNNRWVIDVVFIGPSVSNYRANTHLGGNYTFDSDDITNEVILGLMDRFPGFKELINESEFATNGRVNTWAYGYRYQFQVGYVFGKKK